MMLFALVLAAADPAPAGAKPSSMAAAPDRTPMLDTLLAAHDYAGLATALNNPPNATALLAGLKWERDHMVAGASMWVTLRYAVELWKVAEMRQDDDLRKAATAAMLYAVAAKSVDGMTCKDGTAPDSRLAQFGAGLRPIVLYLRGLPDQVRRQVVESAIALDQATKASPARAEDWYLCSGGQAEADYGRKRGKQAKIPSPDGSGNTIVVVDTSGFEPEFLPPGLSAGAVAEQRKQLVATLATLAGFEHVAHPAP